MKHDISLTLLFQLYTLRKLNQGDAADPRAPLSGNFRPIQALNGRTIRTNIFLAPAEENEVRHNCQHVCFCISFSDFFRMQLSALQFKKMWNTNVSDLLKSFLFVDSEKQGFYFSAKRIKTKQ